MGSWLSKSLAALSQVTQSGAATHVGNYALLGGGFNNAYSYSGRGNSAVYAYNKSLTQTVMDPLSQGRGDLCATHVGDYALFSGGTYYTSDSYMSSATYKNIDVYDSSLTHLTSIVPPTTRNGLSAIHVGNYALFSCGPDKSVEVYDTSLTYSKIDDITATYTQIPLSAHTDDYAIITSNTEVNVYNKSLIKTFLSEGLNVGRSIYNSAATHVGGYALFSGGASADVYDNSLTHSSADRLLRNNYSNFAATHIPKYALFGGGYYGNSDSTYNINVDVYDESLTHSTPSDAYTTYRRQYPLATSIDRYAIFAGGAYSNQPTGYIDALAYKAYIQYGYTLNQLYIPVYD